MIYDKLSQTTKLHDPLWSKTVLYYEVNLSFNYNISAINKL